MFNKLQSFKEQGYILVSRLERQDAINALKEVLAYYPQFDSNVGDDYSNRRQFECFFYETLPSLQNILIMRLNNL